MKPTVNLFTQCELHHSSGLVEVSWIPAKYAVVGKELRIREGKVWRAGWKVIHTYSTKLEHQLLDHERDYLHQREASDI
jgi:hypothetical protein